MTTPPSNSLKNLALVQEQFSRLLLPLHGFLVALGRDTHLADDLLQETFLTACEKCDSFAPGTNFKAWIYAIARFKALNAVRKSARAVRLLSPETIESLAASTNSTADESLRLRFLEHCIAKLRSHAREAITLRYQHAITPQEIATRLGQTANQINVLLFRSRQVLRDCIEQQLAAQSRPPGALSS